MSDTPVESCELQEIGLIYVKSRHSLSFLYIHGNRPGFPKPGTSYNITQNSNPSGILRTYLDIQQNLENSQCRVGHLHSAASFFSLLILFTHAQNSHTFAQFTILADIK